MEAKEIIRMQTYILLSRLLNEQTKQDNLPTYLTFIKSFDTGQALEALEGLFKTWLAEEDADKKLQTEFASLFLLRGGVKPYASVYLGEDPMLMQQPWVDIKKFYQKCGWQLEGSEKHPEDHAAVVLSFMAHLISTADDKLQKEFFEQHIVSWLPSFLHDLQEKKHANFYREVAAYGLSFLNSEHKLLKGKNKKRTE